jgi:hypothetical protein
MITEATTFSRHIQEQDAGYKTFTKPNSLRRFRYFIEHFDWDDVIRTQEEWIDKLCVGVIIVGSLYFIPPVLAMLFLRELRRGAPWQ